MRRSRQRPAAALIMAVVALGVLGILLGSIVVQAAATRRAVSRTEHERQALWLARSGIEIGLHKALAEPKQQAEWAVELLPEAEVRVRLRRDKDRIHIESEARYPVGATDAVTRQVARAFRKAGTGDKTRLESEPTE